MLADSLHTNHIVICCNIFPFIVHWFIRNGYAITMVLADLLYFIARTHYKHFAFVSKLAYFENAFSSISMWNGHILVCVGRNAQNCFSAFNSFQCGYCSHNDAHSSLDIEIHYSRNCVCISDIQTQIYYYRKSAFTNFSRFDLFVFSELRRLPGA